MVNTEVGDFVGNYIARGNISCSISYLTGTNIIMPIEGIERDGGQVIINTECGQFGAKHCEEDYESVVQFYNQYDIELFEQNRALPGNDGALLAKSLCFYRILDNFKLMLQSKGFEVNEAYKQCMSMELYSFAL